MLQRGLRRGNHASSCFVSKCVRVVLLVDTSTTIETGKFIFVSLYKHLIACFRNDSFIVHLWSSWGVPDIPREAWIWSYKNLEKTWVIYMPLSCLNVFVMYTVYTFLGGSPPALLKRVLFYCEAFTLSSGVHNTTNPLRFFLYFSPAASIYTSELEPWTRNAGRWKIWAQTALGLGSYYLKDLAQSWGCYMGHPAILDDGMFLLGGSVFCWIVDTVRTFLRSNLDNQITTFRRHQQNPGTLMQFQNEPRNLFSEADYFAAGYYDVITFRRLLGWLRRSWFKAARFQSDVLDHCIVLALWGNFGYENLLGSEKDQLPDQNNANKIRLLPVDGSEIRLTSWGW